MQRLSPLQCNPVLSGVGLQQAMVVSLVVVILVVFNVEATTAERDTGSTAQLLYRNEFVTLKRVRLDPAGTADLGAPRRAALYFLENGPALIESEADAEDMAAYAQGDILPLRNDFLALHNTGESALEYLFIRSAVSPLTADPPGPTEYQIRTVHMPPVLGKHGVRQVLDNEALRIIEIVLPPGGRIPSTVHLSGVYYALNDHLGEFVLPDDRTEPYQRKGGEAWWMDSGEYAIRNPGSSPMVFVFMGIKPVARYGEYEP